LVIVRAVGAEQARAVTVRVARDGTGAPTLGEGQLPLGAIYQFTPLDWADGDVEIRVPFSSKDLMAGTEAHLVVAQAAGDWMEVVDAHAEGDVMIARVPRLSYATVVAAAPMGTGRSRSLSVRGAAAVEPQPALGLAFDTQATTPALPTPGADGIVETKVNTTLALRLQYSLPAGCTVSPAVSVTAQVTPLNGSPSKVVTLGTRNVANLDGAEKFTLPLSGSDNGTWRFSATAECREPGTPQPRYLSVKTGPTMFVNINGSGGPTIFGIPNVGVKEGSVATLAVVVRASFPSYEWQRSNDGGKTYAIVPGATADKLSFATVLSDDMAMFRVRVTDYGRSVLSSPTVLRVFPLAVAPAITGDPANQTVVENETASFTVAGTGQPAPTIQWQSRAAGAVSADAGWSDISGATAKTYTTGATTLAQDGTQYRAVLRNASGMAASLPATLRVKAKVVAPSIMRGPVSQETEADFFASFSIEAAGTTPLSYQWFKDGTAITGANADTVQVYASPADVGRSYAVTVQVSNSAGVVTSAVATLKVTAPSTTPINASTGGKVAGPEGSKLSIPPGALPSDTPMAIRRIEPGVVPVPGTVTPIGSAFQIVPDDLVFTQPVTITLPLPGDIPDGYELAIVEFAPSGSKATTLSAAGASLTQPTFGRVANVQRLSRAARSLPRIASSSSSGVANVLCAGQAVGSESMSFLTALGGPKVPALVPVGTCSSYVGLPPSGAVPIDTVQGCGNDASKYGDAGLASEKQDVVLKNRHVYCEKLSANFGVALLDRSNPAKDKGLGDAQVEILITGHGPSSRTMKTFEYRFRVVSYTPASADAEAVNPNVTVGVKFECNPVDGEGNCSSSAGTINLSMKGSTSWSSPLVVPVNFTVLSSASGLPLAHFTPTARYVYSSSGDPYAARYQLEMGNTVIPEMRCDLGLAYVGSNGCVFTQAAAVYVLDRNDANVKEAAEHIYEAQLKGSPGKWMLKPRSLAIADPTFTWSNTLQRLKNTDLAQKNRAASCTSSTALINVRPPYSSSTCSPGQAGCQCDEYPFASTWNGGKFDPDRTSVKWINGLQNNKAGGGKLTGFYTTERVLDLTLYPAGAGDSVAWGGGDIFWVHVK
jgi:hypothetical protein